MTTAGIKLPRTAIDLVDTIAREDRYVLSLRLICVLVMLHGYTNEVSRATIQVLCVALLLTPMGVFSAGAWWLLTSVAGLNVATQWDVVDNHAYLICYVSLLATLSLRGPTPLEYLAKAGRILVACVFVLAAAWKLALGEFVDGSFMYVTMLIDPRVQDIGALAAGTSIADVRLATSGIMDIARGSAMVSMPNVASIQTAALLLSWTALGLETAVAFLFAIPGERLATARAVALGLFVITTYWMLPVPGFGFALLVLALPQCKGRRLRNAYLLLMIGLQFTRLPWRSYLGLVQ